MSGLRIQVLYHSDFHYHGGTDYTEKHRDMFFSVILCALCASVVIFSFEFIDEYGCLILFKISRKSKFQQFLHRAAIG
jgi:hypothetical protein